MEAISRNPFRQAEILIRSRLGLTGTELDEMTDDEFWRIYAEALWLEEREMMIMAAAIGKAFGG